MSNQYYVYAHYNEDNSDLVYIGKGRAQRKTLGWSYVME